MAQHESRKIACIYFHVVIKRNSLLISSSIWILGKQNPQIEYGCLWDSVCLYPIIQKVSVTACYDYILWISMITFFCKKMSVMYIISTWGLITILGGLREELMLHNTRDDNCLNWTSTLFFFFNLEASLFWNQHIIYLQKCQYAEFFSGCMRKIVII